MNLILIGLRGTGKTTLGQTLALQLGWPFIDLDQRITSMSNKKIVQIVKEGGWEQFRKEEKKAVRSIENCDHHVISTGGGTVMDDENSKILQKNGFFILLTRNLNDIRDYLKTCADRPSLTGNPIAEEVGIIWEQRKARYHKIADIIHDTTKSLKSTPLLEKLKSHPMKPLLP